MRNAMIAFALAAGLAAHAEDGDRRPPFVTTPADVVEHMLRFAGTGPSDVVIDLGSGDGRIVIAAAQKFGARALGIELDEDLVRQSRESARAANVADRVSFVQGDVLASDISQASVVTVYLLPSLMAHLQPRFIYELKPGTRIVSHAFSMAGWKPDSTETVRLAQRHRGQGDESTLFLWVVPAEVRGNWTAADWKIRIHQNYQEIEIEGEVGGKPVPALEGRLRGTSVTWQGGGLRFIGKVEGERVVGELVDAGRARPLVLTRSR